MAQPMEAIDLTQDDNDSDGSIPCGNPHHAILLNAMRKQLHDKQQEIAELEHRIDARDATIADRQARIVDLQARDAGRVAEITRLEGQVTALQDRLHGRGKRQKRTWPDKLKAYIVDGNRQLSYNKIHDLCCKEENMSTSTGITHPHIRLGVNSNGWKPDGVNALPGQDNAQDNATFPYFHALPAEIQARIFRLWLHKGRPIHSFSRLDPFTAPRSWPVTNSTSGMYNRFYWGDERLFNLTADAVDPQQVLGLLLVSKAFYFKGLHAFYGLNTFAFSSIGEFGRFCKGIGDERAARLQSIELVWTGSHYLSAEHTFSAGKRGKAVENWDSVRTRPFSFFLRLRRLRTLGIFLDESGPLYERRKYESPGTKAQLLARTAFQPNFRKNRCLRTLQGLDNIYALRGLHCIRLYDLWAMNRDVSPVPALHPIRDTSFVADVNSIVTMRKSAEEARDCQLKNLPRLFPSEEGASPEQARAGTPLRPWDPSNADWSIVQDFYDNTPQLAEANVYGPTRTYYGVRDLNAVVDEDGDNGGGPANGNVDRGHNNEPGNGANGGDGGGGGNHGDSDDDSEDGRHDHGGRDNGAGRSNDSLFVHNDDDHDHQEHGRKNAEAGPSRPNRNSHLPHEVSNGPVLQPRPAANLNANAGSTGKKRPSDPGNTTHNKRQKQGEVQPFQAHRNAASFEQLTRDYLGGLTACGSIAPLLNPFAANLKRRDWFMVKRVLQRSEARQNRRIFRDLVESEGRLPGNQSSARRISQALLN